MNTGKNLWKPFSLTAVVALALALTGARGVSWAQAQDDGAMVSIPLSSSGLVFGDGLRTTLFNRGPRQISVQTSVIDADGAVVRQETLVLEPGQTRTVEMSRGEVPRDERSVILRTEVSARRGDARHMLMTSEVFDLSSGSTRYPPGDCDEFGCGSNHNETLVRDTSPTK